MSVRLEVRSHTGLVRSDSYTDVQVARHRLKMTSLRTPSEYQGVAAILLERGAAVPGSRMICMGTRNNHERECFRSLLSGVNVQSLDISAASGADHIMDFTQLPESWDGMWDILYSNSIDHSYDATETFNRWIRVVRPGGVIALGFGYDVETSSSDICAFSHESVQRFFASREDLELLGRARCDYETFVLRKTP